MYKYGFDIQKPTIVDMLYDHNKPNQISWKENNWIHTVLKSIHAT